MTVIVISDENEMVEQLQRADANGQIVIVDFTAKWCGPCQKMAPLFESLSKKYTNTIFLKVDVDVCGDIASHYEVSAMPTFLFLRRTLIIDSVVGADPNKLEKKVHNWSSSITSLANKSLPTVVNCLENEEIADGTSGAIESKYAGAYTPAPTPPPPGQYVGKKFSKSSVQSSDATLPPGPIPRIPNVSTNVSGGQPIPPQNLVTVNQTVGHPQIAQHPSPPPAGGQLQHSHAISHGNNLVLQSQTQPAPALPPRQPVLVHQHPVPIHTGITVRSQPAPVIPSGPPTPVPTITVAQQQQQRQQITAAYNNVLKSNNANPGPGLNGVSPVSNGSSKAHSRAPDSPNHNYLTTEPSTSVGQAKEVLNEKVRRARSRSINPSPNQTKSKSKSPMEVLLKTNKKNESIAQKAVQVQKKLPMSTITIHLADGTRTTASFNTTQPVAKIREFIKKARPEITSPFAIMTAFPSKEITDEYMTLKEAQLVNSIVVQKLKKDK